MINAPQLLADLARLLKRFEDDLRGRIADVVELKAGLQTEWQAARDADRTAETFESWADQVITQAGVHWLLSCVFLRFIEDNELVERPWLSGTPESGRLALARDRHEAYFRDRPLESDRDYLLACFREAGALPGLHTFFDEAHNPVFRLGISGDAAMALRQFWQQVDPNTGALAHNFTDPDCNTRFLGDLYQDLSEAARKRYALLQTPEFVEEFILDRTLTPAIREFGFGEVRMIDPTCGSGHFLLGGFRRLVDEWVRHEPARNPRDIAQRALDAVAGVDLNPFAVAISRFRLLLAALKVSGVHRLTEAPDFKLNVAIGDSLLHGKRFGMSATDGMFEGAEHYAGTGLAHAYASEDLAEVQRILTRQYHAVVGNPPYIVVKDAALNAAYRKRYVSCHMKYSLGAPFTERFFDLAITGNGQPAGFVGMITANSFMKREFGSKLIEHVLPRLDMTHVIDAAGAYIPGHGTPTVILFGRHRAPVSDAVRTVMGIKGEPTTPNDPAHGLVWSAIVEQMDHAGSESAFVSVADTPRSMFQRHPWSIGGGGAAELKESIEFGKSRLSTITRNIGFVAIPGEDDAFVMPMRRAKCLGFGVREFMVGDGVRDWSLTSDSVLAFPYELVGGTLEPKRPTQGQLADQHLWVLRTNLRNRLMFGKTPEQAGLNWWELSFLSKDRLAASQLISFSEVATHNHFVLSRRQQAFKHSAPVINLQAGASEDELLGLLGLLNSSVACFWFKQVCHNKGSTVDQHGARQRTSPFEDFYAFNSTKVSEFPLSSECPLALARTLDTLARDIEACLPAAGFRFVAEGSQPLPSRRTLDEKRDRAARLRRMAVAWQEELDWACYGLYGLLPVDVGALRHDGEPPEVGLGERAFEIALARRVAAGHETTTWFERHGSSPIAEIPSHWPEDYRQVVQRRIDLIEHDRNIGLIERPEYKRRWNTPAWEDLERSALHHWLLDRLEAPQLWPADVDHPPQLITVNRLADAVRTDADFMQIAELYAGHSGFDAVQVIAELVASESVPFLPVLRYTDTGLRKRAQWDATWDLQRKEDAIDAKVMAEESPGWRAELTTEARARFSIDAAQQLTTEASNWVEGHLATEIKRYQDKCKADEVGKIPVPPKYQSKDFMKADFWRLRGGLDVPKERWVSYPGCERGADTSLPIAWAGWNHLQQATALAAYYLDMKENDGWEPVRLQPLLAGLLELVPWLEQWHNEIDLAYGERMGTYYRGFVNEEARALGFTLDDLRRWKPAATPAKRGRKKEVVT